MERNPNPQRSAEGAHGLPGRFVTSPEIFDDESENIFSRNWICVAREEELHAASGCLPIQFESHKLVLVRDASGEVRAMRNFCRHRGSQLITDENCALIGRRIQCPYHAWTYDRSGRLVSAPNMQGVAEFDPTDYGLIRIPCESFGGFIWINFGPTQSLSEWLHPVTEYFVDWSVADLRIAHEIRYRVDANWKLIFQNYSECYHCPIVHPALNRLTPYRGSSNDLTLGSILGGPMGLAEGVETMSNDGSRAAEYLPNLNSDQTRSVYYFTLFPTLFLSLHPDFVLTHRIERVDVNMTQVVCQFLFHPASIGQANFDASGVVDFWDLTNRQDWEVCELAQAGMSDAGYVPGPYSNLESVVAAFDRHYLGELKVEA